MGDLMVAYHKVCAYSGSWTKSSISGVTTLEDSSVDHFVPRSLAPYLAYEWANFRLSRARLNNKKGNHTDVLDPFTLPGRWFTLNFTTFLVSPNTALPKRARMRVQETIDRLELNADDDYVQERANVVREYCLGGWTLATLDRFWPFIAREMREQDFDTLFLPSMRALFRAYVGLI